MAEIRFVVETADGQSIWIRYVPTSRLFCFAIVGRKLQDTLGAEANIVDFNVRRQAHSFAKIGARARDLID